MYKMNEIVNAFLLPGDKFMSEMGLKQSGFTYSACGLFTKNKERNKKFTETENTDFISKNDFIFFMIWLLVIIKIWLKEHNQIRF